MVTNNSCDYQPTQYNVQTGGASGTLNNVAPSATSGVPVISQGSSSQPIFGTAVVAGGGTGVTSVTTVPTATAFAGWDANKNLSANNFLSGYTTTVSSASPIVLTVASTEQQYVTGSTAQTVTLPVTSTLALGQSFTIINLASTVTTVQSSGGNTLQAMAASTELIATCVSTSGTGTASWSWSYNPLTNSGSSSGFDQIVIQTFTSSGTYTPTTGMKYCIIEVVGAGGGGGGVVTGGAGVSTVGGGGGAGGYARSAVTAATIGGSQVVTCGAGGTAGANSGGTGGTGGTSSVGSIISATGGAGGVGSGTATALQATAGGVGGAGTGTFAITGTQGQYGVEINIAGGVNFCCPGSGGNSMLGSGAVGVFTTGGAAGAGSNGVGGGGGSGAYSVGGSGAAAGGVGGVGVVVITEFLSV